jgi:small subunit ribosomal protein S16
VVRIRMNRQGRRHVPFFRINAIEKQVKRDGKVLENLGWYNPGAKDESKQLLLNEERVKFWLAKGAQPSDSMMDILAKRNLVDAAAWKAVRSRQAEARKARAAALAAAPAAKKDAKKA